MVPIYEQGSGHGIGLNAQSFQERFEKICQQHIDQGRAKAFAFIFYDFGDADLRNILKEQGVFAKLDRRAGEKLSIFYLHTSEERGVEAFNTTFLAKLGIAKTVTLPAIVFFKFGNGQVHDITVAQLDHADLVHGFQELYSHIDSYINADTKKSGSQEKDPDSDKKKPDSKLIEWSKSGTEFFAREGFREILRTFIGGLF